MKSSEWSEEKLKQYQNEEFLKLVEHCYKNVPYYQEVFAEYGLGLKSIQSVDDITKLPILNKETIRKNFDKLQATNFDHNEKSTLFLQADQLGKNFNSLVPMRYSKKKQHLFLDILFKLELKCMINHQFG